MIRTVETVGSLMLCSYPRNGWAIFEYKPTKPDEPDWKCVINGRFDDVMKKYQEMRLTHS